MAVLRPLQAVLLLIAAAAIAGPAWAVFVYTPPHDYQALAEASCKCARLASGKTAKAACWRDFDSITDNARVGSAGTACFPLSEIAIDVPGHSWLPLSWELVGGRASFCTRDEAIAAEALYESLDAGDPSLPQDQQDAGISRALAALERLSQAYARGEPVTPARPRGCTG